MLGAAGRLLLLAACAGCVAPPPAPRGGPGPADGYHGVVVWLGRDGRNDTVAVSFPTAWQRTAAGTDTAWTFRADEGRAVTYGRLEGNRLVWGQGRMQGNFGQTVEFSGPIEAGGRVRGCSLPPRRLPRYRTTYPAAAFALAPRGAPPPSAADAPVGQCGAGR